VVAFVDGRAVYLVKGSQSQTVNICTMENRRGMYESRFRLDAHHVISDPDVSRHPNLDHLKAWLRAVGAREEGSRTGDIGDRPARPSARLVDVEADEAWLDNAVRLVDVAGYSTQPVHKEWPETTAREGKDGRRGNFDLAILSAKQLESATVNDFRSGRIAAPIVIEMGLDYDFAHLQQDHDKLLNSAVRAGYLVDFVRNRPPDERTEQLILNPSKPLKTAYGHHWPGRAPTFKTVAATSLQCRQQPARDQP
jgi:hypothetical protein